MTIMKRIDQKVIETIRLLSADAVEKAKSGHPGLPMGSASMAYVLWKDFLKGSATDPKWVDRDRFILSAGHGSMLLYSLLHLFGYELSMDDIKRFRQHGSITPGHPEYNITPGVETTTGPLGQGVGNGVGMAIAERRLAAEFNTTDFTIIDHHTYVIAGDGCMMEGVSSEAASLAGHLRLGKLIVLYDDNNITIDGSTSISFTEDVGARYEAYGWQVIRVDDGNNCEKVSEALKLARMNSTQPTLIMVKNIIGYGSPNKAGRSISHGAPLGEAELAATKQLMGWDPEVRFEVPDEVIEYMKEVIDSREIDRFLWEERLEEYMVKYPEKARLWKQWFDYELPSSLFTTDNLLASVQKNDATRNHGGAVLNTLFAEIPNLMGGSADLNESTKTHIKASGSFSWENPKGNNVHFGVREHGMGAILNGMAIHGGLRVFGSTFLVFSDYMKPAIRLAALMQLPTIFIFTHDSIAVGEDGPTHQPVEHLTMLRSIPNLNVYRPADGKETAIAWVEALKRSDGPSAIILSRQALPNLEGVNKEAHRGGYVIHEETKYQPDAILMASGSEVSLAVEAAKRLMEHGVDVRVVSMLSMEQFDKQAENYRNEVLIPECRRRIAVEAGHKMPWYKYVGLDGAVLGINRFGESAPGDEVMRRFGFDVSTIVDMLLHYLKE